MTGFTTLGSMFVCNMVLLICFTASGEIALAMLPALGSLITGCGLVRMVAVPAARRDDTASVTE